MCIYISVNINLTKGIKYTSTYTNTVIYLFPKTKIQVLQHMIHVQKSLSQDTNMTALYINNDNLCVN